VQAGWDPGAVNSVVLLTDGRNDDANGITLEQLVATLKTLHDPRYPIQVVAIGFGEEVSRDELETITATTGGGAFIAYQASEILPIFLQALSVRPAG
jgi:secreted protein with Ig-like and vWFA domain